MPQKYFRKFRPPEQRARALQTDDRQTDGWATAYSERERELTFANKISGLILKALNDDRISYEDFSLIWSEIDVFLETNKNQELIRR